jgi:hypothetical protein
MAFVLVCPFSVMNITLPPSFPHTLKGNIKEIAAMNTEQVKKIVTSHHGYVVETVGELLSWFDSVYQARASAKELAELGFPVEQCGTQVTIH